MKISVLVLLVQCLTLIFFTTDIRAQSDKKSDTGSDLDISIPKNATAEQSVKLKTLREEISALRKECGLQQTQIDRELRELFWDGKLTKEIIEEKCLPIGDCFTRYNQKQIEYLLEIKNIGKERR